MPKKPNNVFVNENCVHLITKYCDSADISKAAFSRKFGKHDRWVSELARGRSMPSPEEAARICAMLQASPEDILQLEGSTEEGTEKRRADIELVRGLLEQEREKSAKKERPADGEALIRNLPEDIQQIIKICVDHPELASALLAVAQQVEKGQAARA